MSNGNFKTPKTLPHQPQSICAVSGQVNAN